MKSKNSLFVSFLLLTMIILTGCPDKDIIYIGYKDSTEQQIVAQMFLKVIEKETPYDVVLNQYGSSQLALQALKDNKIHVYPEEMEIIHYTLLEQKTEKGVEELQDFINESFKDDQLQLLNHLGYEKKYALALKQKKTDELSIKTMSDLEKEAKNLNLATSYSFLDEKKGKDGMKDAYSYDFKTVQAYEGELRYIKLGDNDVDVVQVFTTDGYIKIMDLVLLEDDEDYFKAYHIAPLISQKLKDDYPDTIEALEKLEYKISEEDITKLEIQVIEDKISVKKAVEDYLKEKGIID